MYARHTSANSNWAHCPAGIQQYVDFPIQFLMRLGDEDNPVLIGLWSLTAPVYSPCGTQFNITHATVWCYKMTDHMPDIGF